VSFWSRQLGAVQSEQQKIRCGEQHFKELDDITFKVAADLNTILTEV
jgi:hypothetical protein